MNTSDIAKYAVLYCGLAIALSVVVVIALVLAVIAILILTIQRFTQRD